MLRKGISRVSRRWRSTELAAAPFVPAVNASHVPTAARLPPVLSDAPDTSVLPPVSADHWDESWGADALASAHESNVVATWGPTKAIAGVPMMVRGEGVYLYDAAGKEYIDWTSQAICVNLGHSPPPAVQEAVARQLNALPFVYGGLAATEPRARLAALLSEVMPADLNGFLFPSGGAEANEAAVRVARRYTGRRKVLSMYRSYHGGTSTTLAATGDFRRNFDEATVTLKSGKNEGHGEDSDFASHIGLGLLTARIVPLRPPCKDHIVCMLYLQGSYMNRTTTASLYACI